MVSRNISVLLIDDEEDSLEVLSLLLQPYVNLTVVAQARDIATAYEQIVTHNPDLIFLDINMPKGDGFSLLNKFETISFQVIFVTSYDQYAINAIKVNALDYLLKPVSLQELDTAIMKAVNRIEEQRNISEQIKQLLANSTHNNFKKIMVHHLGKVNLIDPQLVLYVSAAARYCTVHLVDGSAYTIAKNLSELATSLEDAGTFIRINKSQLLNTIHITSYSKGRSCLITLTNDHTFEVSRRKKPKILDQLQVFSP